MDTLRWIVMLPAAILGALIFTGFALKIMALLTFDVAFLEGLAIYGIYGALPSIACLIGLSIAPKKSNRVKWAILAPQILVVIVLFVPALIGIFLGKYSPDENQAWDGFDSLSTKWQLVLVSIGLLMGIFYAGSRPVSEYSD